IAAFKRRRRFDLHNLAMFSNGGRNPGNLGTPGIATRPRQHCNLIQHQRGILKKAAVGTLIVGGNLKHANPQASQHFLVLLMLLNRALEGYGLTINEGEFAFRDSGRNGTSEGSRYVGRYARRRLDLPSLVWIIGSRSPHAMSRA